MVLPGAFENVIAHALRYPSYHDSPPNVLQIAAVQLHKLDEWLIAVRTVAEQLSDETQFERYRWHSIAATSEEREMFRGHVRRFR